MTDWRIRLRDADRALDAEVDPDAAERVRQSVLATSRASLPETRSWSRTFVAAAATLALVCVALLTALQDVKVAPVQKGTTADIGDPALDSPSTPDRQQLQFSTPGGTRIIWVFDPGFEVKGTLP
jgi:hypothetical protein